MRKPPGWMGRQSIQESVLPCCTKNPTAMIKRVRQSSNVSISIRRMNRRFTFRPLLTHREGKLEVAESQLRDLLSSYPKHQFIAYASRYLLAEILDRTGRFDEAMQQLSKAKAFVSKLPFSRNAFKLMPSKEQRQSMIAAFREHPKNFGKPCRTVLSGANPEQNTEIRISGRQPTKRNNIARVHLGSAP